MDYFIASVLIWWMFAIPILGVLLADKSASTIESVALAVFWPLLLAPVAVVLTYGMFVKAPGKIRADIRNRGLIREFECFLEERKKQNDL